MQNASTAAALIMASLMPGSLVTTMDRAPAAVEAPSVEAPSIGAETSGAAALPAEVADEPAVQLTNDERALVDWAYDRFAEFGLELPPTHISFHESNVPCNYNEGLFRSAGEAPEILVCVGGGDSLDAQLHRRRTLVHELAHLWDYTHLDDQTRNELLHTLGADAWIEADVAWDERGIERLAETIVWGLYEQRRRPVLIDVSCLDLYENFLAIVGRPAAGPIEPVCLPEHQRSNTEHQHSNTEHQHSNTEHQHSNTEGH